MRLHNDQDVQTIPSLRSGQAFLKLVFFLVVGLITLGAGCVPDATPAPLTDTPPAPTATPQPTATPAPVADAVVSASVLNFRPVSE